MTRTKPLALAATLSALGCWTTAHAAVVTYGPDDTMTTPEWSIESTYLNNGTATFALSNSTSGTSPNPGAALRSDVVYTGTGSGSWRKIIADTSWTYNPSLQGAIDSLAFNIDVASNTANGFVSFAVVQDGVGYVGEVAFRPLLPGNNDGFVNFDWSGITASDFRNIDGNAGNPDFSGTGSELTLGFSIGRGFGGGFAGPTATNITRFDNAQITVIPEPASLALVLAGGGLMLARRRQG
jgi:hypothetical protein